MTEIDWARYVELTKERYTAHFAQKRNKTSIQAIIGIDYMLSEGRYQGTYILLWMAKPNEEWWFHTDAVKDADGKEIVPADPAGDLDAAMTLCKALNFEWVVSSTVHYFAQDGPFEAATKAVLAKHEVVAGWE